MTHFTYLAAFSLVLLASTAHADMTKYSCRASTPKSIAAIVDDNACLGYEIKADDGTVTKTVKFPFKGSGDLIASADGRTVVMLQSYLPGHADQRGKIVEDGVGMKSLTDPIGLHVYRDGVRVATHKIADLIKRKHLVFNSISHVRWIRNTPASLATDSFTITTTSFRDLTFETKTGALLREDDAALWSRCDQIVVGKLDVKNGKLLNTYSFKTKKHVAELPFVRDPAVELTHNASATACLERRGDEHVLTELL